MGSKDIAGESADPCHKASGSQAELDEAVDEELMTSFFEALSGSILVGKSMASGDFFSSGFPSLKYWGNTRQGASHNHSTQGFRFIRFRGSFH